MVENSWHNELKISEHKLRGFLKVTRFFVEDWLVNFFTCIFPKLKRKGNEVTLNVITVGYRLVYFVKHFIWRVVLLSKKVHVCFKGKLLLQTGSPGSSNLQD